MTGERLWIVAAMLFVLAAFVPRLVGEPRVSRYPAASSSAIVLENRITEPAALGGSPAPPEIQAAPASKTPDARGGENSGSRYASVVRVVDGDTIDVVFPALPETIERVRYIGMDTPEIYDPRRPVQCFGKEAAAANAALLAGRTVRLEKDVSERDRYGRLLEYVYVENADGSETFVNLKLVEGGWARAATYPPDVKFAGQFTAAARAAAEAGLGLWSACP